jgi:hypothetical protein
MHLGALELTLTADGAPPIILCIDGEVCDASVRATNQRFVGEIGLST